MPLHFTCFCKQVYYSSQARLFFTFAEAREKLSAKFESRLEKLFSEENILMLSSNEIIHVSFFVIIIVLSLNKRLNSRS